MTEARIGHCLPLYLTNLTLLSALREDEKPSDADDDQKLFAQFHERASDQAVGVLEDLYTTLLCAQGAGIPYRCDRRSQRRTVRDQWYMEGRLFRPRERLARSYWNLFLGSLRDKGPAVTFVVGPQETASASVFDEMAILVAKDLEMDSANPRNCFVQKAGYEAGIVISYCTLTPGVSHRDLTKATKENLERFFSKYRPQFEAAIDA